MTTLPNTFIAIRVQALGGKFLGDDIGGALITVRDAQTGELLATGSTAGNSGTLSPTYAPNASLSTIVTPTPGQPPTIQWLLAVDTNSRSTTTSVFHANLVLDRPTLLEIEARGPFGGLQSAHRVIATEWIVPGQNLTAAPGLVLLIPGLLVQVMSPATHTQYMSAPCTDRQMPIEASVAMMCGCPISDAPNNPWFPSDFDVSAQIRVVGGPLVQQLPLTFKPGSPASRFAGMYVVPLNTTTSPIFYEMTITARQLTTGNVGTGTVTFFAQPASST